jgi:hypothetical protein
LLPGVASSIIGGVAEALENLAVAAMSLLANFLARDLSAARARQAEPQDAIASRHIECSFSHALAISNRGLGEPL